MTVTPERTHVSVGEWLLHANDLDGIWAPQLLYTCFYNHAHRPRLEKLLCLELSRSSNGFFKPLLDPDGGFNSETAERQH
jgi:hypothetical protein